MKKPRITLKQLAVLSPVLLAAGAALVLLAAWGSPCWRRTFCLSACLGGARSAAALWASRSGPCSARTVRTGSRVCSDRPAVPTLPPVCPNYAQGGRSACFARSPVDLQTKSLLSPGCAFFCQAGCGKIVSDPRRKRGRDGESGTRILDVPRACGAPENAGTAGRPFPPILSPPCRPPPKAQSQPAAAAEPRISNPAGPHLSARPQACLSPASFPILHRKERCP